MGLVIQELSLDEVSGLVDLQAPVFNQCEVTERGVNAEVVALRRLLAPQRFIKGVTDNLVEAGDRLERVPVQPIDPADELLIAAAVAAPAEQEVQPAGVETLPGFAEG